MPVWSVTGTCTTDALAEMLHEWYKATEHRQTFVRVLLVNYTKAFDLINHDILINMVTDSGMSPHIVRWMAAFLLNRTRRVKLGDIWSLWSYLTAVYPKVPCLDQRILSDKLMT